jgi:translation elongation factor EF-4
MTKDDVVEYVKALTLTPGSILVVDANSVDMRTLTNLRLALDFPVPILAIYGTPSIEAFTREQLVQALRLIDESAGEIPA